MTEYSYDLFNDERVVISIKGRDAAGKFEPLPSEPSFRLTNSNEAALDAEIGVDHVGAPALIISRRVAQAEGIEVELSDEQGLTPVRLIVNIRPNPAARGLDLDIINASSTPLPPPDSRAGQVSADSTNSDSSNSDSSTADNASTVSSTGGRGRGRARTVEPEAA